jgi:hypothetical protein
MRLGGGFEPADMDRARRSADIQPRALRQSLVRPFLALLTCLLATAVLAGGSQAQMRPGHGFGGGFGRGQGGAFRGPPGRGMPYRSAPSGFYGPPSRGFYRPPPGFDRPPPRGANSLGADRREQQEEARQGVRHGQLAPLGRVIQGIGRRAAGRQLDTGIEYRDGRPVYRVRWVTPHGRRIDYIVDAATGAILGER